MAFNRQSSEPFQERLREMLGCISRSFSFSGRSSSTRVQKHSPGCTPSPCRNNGRQSQEEGARFAGLHTQEAGTSDGQPRAADTAGCASAWFVNFCHRMLARRRSVLAKPGRTAKDNDTDSSAWTVLAGTTCLMMVSFGFLQILGLLIQQAEDEFLHEKSRIEIGVLAGVCNFFGLLAATPFSSIIDIYGPDSLLVCVVLFHIPMPFALSFCRGYYKLLGGMGFYAGISCALCASIGITVNGKLFSRWNGLASGINMAGSSFGGVIYPLALKVLLPRYGWEGSILRLGVMMAVITSLGLTCVFHYYPKVRPNEASIRNESRVTLFSRKAFRDRRLSLTAVGMLFLEFAILGMCTIMPVLSDEAGFDKREALNMLAILSGLSSAGRILPGLAADWTGPFNMFVMSIAATMVFMASFMVPFGTTDVTKFYATAALWGIASGSWLSVMPSCISEMCEKHENGRYYGTITLVMSPSSIACTPVCCAMLDKFGPRSTLSLMLAMVSAGGCFIFAARGVAAGGFMKITKI